MPYKYLVRNLRGNSYYHIYNRGIENKNIFLDRQDCETFLYYMYIYTARADKIKLKYPNLPTRLKSKNMATDIYLIAYCLMPDHFHILLKQESIDAMPRFMKQITNGYTTYFNKKYKKTGPVFLGRYKSVRLDSEYLLIQMVRFVHLNPSIAKLTEDLSKYQWSSYINDSYTIGMINRFASKEEWEKFNLNIAEYNQNFEKIKNLTLDVLP